MCQSAKSCSQAEFLWRNEIVRRYLCRLFRNCAFGRPGPSSTTKEQQKLRSGTEAANRFFVPRMETGDRFLLRVSNPANSSGDFGIRVATVPVIPDFLEFVDIPTMRESELDRCSFSQKCDCCSLPQDSLLHGEQNHIYSSVVDSISAFRFFLNLLSGNTPQIVFHTRWKSFFSFSPRS